MNRNRLVWLALLAALAVLVSYQVMASSAKDRAEEFAARADVPTVQPGVDVLDGIVVVPARIHRYDYRRAAFGEAWTDDNDAPGGHNGCDTRDDILNRDLVDKTYVWLYCHECGWPHVWYGSWSVTGPQARRTSARAAWALWNP
jgi:hypothetical protein